MAGRRFAFRDGSCGLDRLRPGHVDSRAAYTSSTTGCEPDEPACVPPLCLCRVPARPYPRPEPMTATVVVVRSSAKAVIYYERDGYYARNDPEAPPGEFLVRGCGAGAGAQGPRASIALRSGAVGIRARDGSASRPDARGAARAPAGLRTSRLSSAEVGVAGGAGDAVDRRRDPELTTRRCARRSTSWTAELLI